MQLAHGAKVAALSLQISALETERDEMQGRLRTTEGERDAARSEARVRNFEIAVARKGRGDLRKAEAVDVLEETTDAGNASELQDEI